MLTPKPPAIVEQRFGVLPRSPRQRDVRLVLERGHTKARQPRLGEAEHVAFASQLEVPFG